MSGPLGPQIGLILTRAVVPGWVVTGAVFKLVENTPRTLPRETILNVADQFHFNLYYLLATLIGLEFLAVAVMVCLSRLARPMAIFMLSAFCLILIGELTFGNFSSCGCLGTHSPPPWVILIIDGALLLGVVAFDPTSMLPAKPARWPALLALLMIAGGFGISFSYTLRSTEIENGEHGENGENGGHVENGEPVRPVERYWFKDDVGEWVGSPWREIDLFGYITEAPTTLDSGKRYVVFYGRGCDHCDEMFHLDLTNPALGSMTTAVLVPHSKTEKHPANPWPMPRTEVEHFELPVGVDWIMTTPLTVTLEDGIVTCATEGDHRACMGLE